MFRFNSSNFLFKFLSLSSKSALFTKCACFNLAAKFSDVNLLSSCVVLSLT